MRFDRYTVSSFAVALALATTIPAAQASPFAQVPQPFSLHAVQSSTGAVFLVMGSTVWPVFPNPIGDNELASIAIGDPTNTVEVDSRLAPPPTTRVVQASDGSLYVTTLGSRWNTGFPLIPDLISDNDLNALTRGSELDGTVPLDLATNPNFAPPTAQAPPSDSGSPTQTQPSAPSVAPSAAVPSDSGAWSQFGFDAAHSSFNPQHAPFAVSSLPNAPTPTLLAYSTGSFDAPVLANGILYARADSLYAIDPANAEAGIVGNGCEFFPSVPRPQCSGAPLWGAVPGSGYTQSSPVVANGVLYIIVGDNQLQAYDTSGTINCAGTPKICSPLWTAATASSPSSGVQELPPTVADGIVYVSLTVGDRGNSSKFPPSRLVAFDAAGNTNCTGTPKTCAPLWMSPRGPDELAPGYTVGTPAVAGGKVYANIAGKLSVFDAAGRTNCGGSPKVCAPLWTATAIGALTTSPVVSNGVVYAQSGSGALYAFDAEGRTNCSGAPANCDSLWNTVTDTATERILRGTTGAKPVLTAVGNGLVYTTTNITIRAFDAAGKTNCKGTPPVCAPLWTAPDAPAEVNSPGNTPIVAGGLVFVGGSDSLALYDPTGTANCDEATTRACHALRRYGLSAPLAAGGPWPGPAPHTQLGGITGIAVGNSTVYLGLRTGLASLTLPLAEP